jgi:hypothetical protein
MRDEGKVKQTGRQRRQKQAGAGGFTFRQVE